MESGNPIRRENLANLAGVLLNYKPLTNERGEWRGEFRAVDPSIEHTRDELIMLIAKGIKELHEYVLRCETAKEEMDTILESAGEAKEFLDKHGYEGQGLFDSIVNLNDKHQQALDIIRKVANHEGDGPELRSIARKYLLWRGDAGKDGSNREDSSDDGDFRGSRQ